MPQLRMWTRTHLKGVGWYLDCQLGYVHTDEMDLKSLAETADKPALLFGEVDKLDEEARLKLVAKVEAEDKKKSLKITQHQEKVAARERGKLVCERRAESRNRRAESRKFTFIQ
jgi:hypothetical protein